MFFVWLIFGIGSLIYGLMVRGLNSGSRTYLMWYALAVVCFAFAWAAKVHLWGKLPAAVRGIFLGLVIAGGLTFLAGLGLIVRGWTARTEKNLDYLIVLGAQVTEQGPSVVLRYRLDAAAEYLRENENTICIVSGGKGDNEHISEAQGMQQYLVSLGIDPERIRMEDQSTSTAENLAFSARFLDPEKDRVGLVSNNFHIYRAVGIAAKAGYKNVSGLAAYSSPLYLPNNMTREVIVLVKDLLTGKMILH